MRAQSLEALRHLRWGDCVDNDLLMWDKWAGAVASALAAASYWGHGRGRRSAGCTEGSGGGGSNSGTVGGCSQQQQQQQQQLEVRMQQAAYFFGEAAEKLLLADARQGASAPSLLMALAGHCPITEEALQQYVQVLHHEQADCIRPCSLDNTNAICSMHHT